MLVAKHLTKLFDSMAKIKMEDETRFSLFSLSVLYLPAFSITAVAMTAKDGEEVAFFKACLCEGQVRRWPGGQVARMELQVLLISSKVEKWLKALMSTMRETVRNTLMQVTTSTKRRILFTTQAMSTYEETAREKWLFNYPAQVALAGTQIGWTSEVIFSFKAIGTTFYLGQFSLLLSGGGSREFTEGLL